MSSWMVRDKPLLGLDHIFEVLDLPKQTANYHCSLCNTSQVETSPDTWYQQLC